MKFQVKMKDPDTLYDAIQEAVENDLDKTGITDPEEREAIGEVRTNKVREVAGAFFEYGEYLTVEIDTVAKTCIVVRPS